MRMKKATHADIADLDVTEGRWYKCRLCSNNKSADGKFNCRPFAVGEVTGKSGHMESNAHKKKKELESKPTIMSKLAQKQFLVEASASAGASSAEVGPATPSKDQPLLEISGSPVRGPPSAAASQPKAKVECEGSIGRHSIAPIPFMLKERPKPAPSSPYRKPTAHSRQILLDAPGLV